MVSQSINASLITHLYNCSYPFIKDSPSSNTCLVLLIPINNWHLFRFANCSLGFEELETDINGLMPGPLDIHLSRWPPAPLASPAQYPLNPFPLTHCLLTIFFFLMRIAMRFLRYFFLLYFLFILFFVFFFRGLLWWGAVWLVSAWTGSVRVELVIAAPGSPPPPPHPSASPPPAFWLSFRCGLHIFAAQVLCFFCIYFPFFCLFFFLKKCIYWRKLKKSSCCLCPFCCFFCFFFFVLPKACLLHTQNETLDQNGCHSDGRVVVVVVLHQQDPRGYPGMPEPTVTQFIGLRKFKCKSGERRLLILVFY